MQTLLAPGFTTQMLLAPMMQSFSVLTELGDTNLVMSVQSSTLYEVCAFSSIQFSPWMIRSSGVHEGWFSRNPLPVFSAGGHCEQFWHGQGMFILWYCSSSISSAYHGSPTLQSALKDGFGEAVVACDMPCPCEFPSLDSCQKRFLWTHKEVDLALHPVIGVVLHVGDAEKLLMHLVLKAWILSSESASRVHVSQP